VGEDGTVWYVHRSRWVGLDQSGNPIGSFGLLRGTTMLALSRDHAWVGESDGKGGSHIVRYRIER
jgi:hypothetical protein